MKWWNMGHVLENLILVRMNQQGICTVWSDLCYSLYLKSMIANLAMCKLFPTQGLDSVKKWIMNTSGLLQS